MLTNPGKTKYILLLLLAFNFSDIFAQTGKVTLGAYYFDGWSGAYSYHLTPDLTQNYSNRESKWGWITSSQTVMDSQITVAANAGLSFFDFCWFYTGPAKYKTEPLDRSLNFYLNSPNKNRLKFALIVVNTGSASVGPNNWDSVTTNLIGYFKSSQYLTVGGKPYVSFFTLKDLIDKFGSEDAVKQALNAFRNKAAQANLPGISIGICTNPDNASLTSAQNCGFDILTGYNYHGAGFKSNQKTVPIGELSKGEKSVWDKFAQANAMPVIPTTTLNWDPRPWAKGNAYYSNSPRYTGFSSASVYQSVKNLKTWIQNNPSQTTQEKIGLIYAWNEYGEGSWLTPSANSTDDLLGGVKKAVSGQ